MFTKKLGIGTGAVAVVIVVAIAVPAGAQRSLGQGRPEAAARTTVPAWLTGLQVKSEALNRRHGLGTSTLRPAGTTRAAWLEALRVRSDALNRKYGLGEYAVSK